MPPRKAAAAKPASTKAASAAPKRDLRMRSPSTSATPAPKAKATKRKRDDEEEEEEAAAVDAADEAPASPAAAPASPTAAAAAAASAADPALLTLDALKSQLKSWGLQSSGVKGDLIKRYRAFQKTGQRCAARGRDGHIERAAGFSAYRWCSSLAFFCCFRWFRQDSTEEEAQHGFVQKFWHGKGSGREGSVRHRKQKTG